MSKKQSSGLKYFSQESSGLKIAPKTVLIMSLIYIGLVVLLHIYAKISTTKPAKVQAPEQAKAEPTATPTPDAQAQQPKVQTEL